MSDLEQEQQPTRLTVGDVREAIDGLPDDAQMFVGISCGPDLAITHCWASQQIPWSNEDWQEGDPLVIGLELATEYFDLYENRQWLRRALPEPTDVEVAALVDAAQRFASDPTGSHITTALRAVLQKRRAYR